MHIQSDKIKIEFSEKTGGSILSFQYFNGREFVDILRPALSDNDPLDTSSFPLFPFSNRIVNADFDFNGAHYDMPVNMPPESHSIHGISWQRASVIHKISDTHVEILHTQNDADYPFHYQAKQIWKIEGDTVNIDLAITNNGEKTMPFGMGIHPYFTRTPNTTIQATSKRVILNSDKMIPVDVSDIPEHLDFTKARKVNAMNMDHCFLEWDGSFNFQWPELGAALNMSAEPVFGSLVVFIPNDENFFCAEPVTNVNDAYNNPLKLDQTGLKTLPPKGIMQGSIKFNFTTL